MNQEGRSYDLIQENSREAKHFVGYQDCFHYENIYTGIDTRVKPSIYRLLFDNIPENEEEKDDEFEIYQMIRFSVNGICVPPSIIAPELSYMDQYTVQFSENLWCAHMVKPINQESFSEERQDTLSMQMPIKIDIPSISKEQLGKLVQSGHAKDENCFVIKEEFFQKRFYEVFYETFQVSVEDAKSVEAVGSHLLVHLLDDENNSFYFSFMYDENRAGYQLYSFDTLEIEGIKEEENYKRIHRIQQYLKEKHWYRVCAQEREHLEKKGSPTKRERELYQADGLEIEMKMISLKINVQLNKILNGIETEFTTIYHNFEHEFTKLRKRERIVSPKYYTDLINATINQFISTRGEDSVMKENHNWYEVHSFTEGE